MYAAEMDLTIDLLSDQTALRLSGQKIPC